MKLPAEMDEPFWKVGCAYVWPDTGSGVRVYRAAKVETIMSPLSRGRNILVTFRSLNDDGRLFSCSYSRQPSAHPPPHRHPLRLDPSTPSGKVEIVKWLVNAAAKGRK